MSDQEQDRGPNDPIYYAPRWIRERTAPSESAAARPDADRKLRPVPPDQIPDVRHDRRDPRHHKQPDIFAEAIAKAERQSREPSFVEAPPELQKRASFGLAAKFAVAVSVAIVIALGFIVVFPSSQDRVEESTLAGLPAWQSLKASVAAATQRRPAPTLIVRDSSGLVNEPLRLGVIVEDPTPGVFVTIKRVPADARLTVGRRMSASEWRIQAQDIADAAIIPPADFVGGLILSAELHGADGAAVVGTFVGLSWTAQPTGQQATPANNAAQPLGYASAPPLQPVTPPPSAATVAAIAPASPEPALPAPALPAPASPASALPAATASQSRTDTVQEYTPNEIAAFIRRAQELLASGDLPAARNYLTRAVAARDARAALLLAKTFDPMVSRQMGAADQGPDLAQALNWYQRAREWGSPEAQRQLDALASYPRNSK